MRIIYTTHPPPAQNAHDSEQMKFFDLNAANEELKVQLDLSFSRVLSSGWVILGPELEAFEAEFAAFCEADHCVGVANGLDAITLILNAAKVAPGDEVIVPAHTFIATWLAVAAVGAKIVPVEVDERTYTISPAAAASAITNRTAAIIAVSLYGHPVDIDPLMVIAQRHNLMLVEDAAQSHGARYKGRRTGSLAHATAFSFYPTKNLGALGDAGGVVTNDAELAAKIRRLRNYGSDQKYIHTEAGVNSRLDEMQAAFLRVRLQVLDRWNEQRRALARLYDQHLAHIDALTIPHVSSAAEHVFHLYVVRAENRDRVADALKRNSISSLIHYPVPCHLQTAFADLGFTRGTFPLAERLADEVLSLPIWPQMSEGAPKRVAEALASISHHK